jgi:hypothetical protein
MDSRYDTMLYAILHIGSPRLVNPAVRGFFFKRCRGLSFATSVALRASYVLLENLEVWRWANQI